MNEKKAKHTAKLAIVATVKKKEIFDILLELAVPGASYANISCEANVN